jgi:superfamily II DNA or RNA helicase
MKHELREWQSEVRTSLLASFETRRDFLVTATPGAGKTTLALSFAHELIRASKIDHVHVVTPTSALRKHWQDAATEWGIRLGRRSNWSLRTKPLPFDIGGIATTYSQVANEADAHAANIEHRRALVILDECHHSGDRRAWGEAVKEAFGEARFRLHLSGTPFRQDGNVIPFINYSIDGISISDGDYKYARAIKENVCRPVLFRSYNALLQYAARGQRFEISIVDDDCPKSQEAERLRFALHPEAGLVEQMVRDADDEIQAIRAKGARWSDAAGILVAMSQEHAYKCAQVIKDVTGQEPVVVVSDSDSAEEDLMHFKDSVGRWVVAVRMISEGVDIPRLMVAVYATNITATLFFRQFVGRVVRVQHFGREESATVFLPADHRLIDEAKDIEAEVQQFLKDEPEAFPAIRKALEAKQRTVSEVVPQMTEFLRVVPIIAACFWEAWALDEAKRIFEIIPSANRITISELAYGIQMSRGPHSEAAA